MMVRQLASVLARSGVFKNVAKVGYCAKVTRGRELKQLSSLLPRVSVSRSRPSVPGSFSLRVYNVAAAPLERRQIEAPKEAHGFELTRREYVKEYDSDVLQYTHKKTGN